MLSQTAEYALRAVVYLADQDQSQAQTVENIAKTTKVPVGYLAKIMQGLAKDGIVSSQRGLYGGFLLVRQAKDLTVYDVVKAMAPMLRITTCPLGLEDHGTNLCPLHRELDNAMATVETALKKLTIHQLLNQPKSRRPLCNFPRADKE